MCLLFVVAVDIPASNSSSALFLCPLLTLGFPTSERQSVSYSTLPVSTVIMLEPLWQYVEESDFFYIFIKLHPFSVCVWDCDTVPCPLPLLTHILLCMCMCMFVSLCVCVFILGESQEVEE